MRSTARSCPIRAWFTRLALVLVAGLAAGPGAVMAQDDPPGRVGRLADMQGQVWWFDVESGAWSEAERNRPLTGGDRLSTAPDARAELRVGSTVLRLGGVTELEVLRLDDEHMDFQLHTGSLALRVRSREVAGEARIVTAELPLRPLRSGHYRFDRIDDSTHVGTWRGSLRVDEPEGLVIDTGQRAEFWREDSARALRHAWGSLPDDDFSRWVTSEDLRDQRSAATRHVSPEMTGAEDLDRHGRWDTHPEYGAIWFPHTVRTGWVPYRYGRWVWVRPWGWTWVDEAPWGFAPFHYGRWVNWRGRWGWWPGAYVARPAYAPAMVAWVGGAGWAVSVNVGGPAIGWVPLAPHEAFVPWYRATPRHVDHVNRHPPPRSGHRPAPRVPQVPTGPVMYGNQGVPGAVTVVPRDVLVQRQPVGRAVIEPRGTLAPGRDWVGVQPPPGPVSRAGADGPRTGPGQRPPQPVMRDRHEPRDARETGDQRAGREAGGARPRPVPPGDPAPGAGRGQQPSTPVNRLAPRPPHDPRTASGRPEHVVTTAPQPAQAGQAAPQASTGPARRPPAVPAAGPQVSTAPVPATPAPRVGPPAPATAARPAPAPAPAPADPDHGDDRKRNPDSRNPGAREQLR